MASITINTIPSRTSTTSELQGDSKFIVFNTNGEPSSVSIDQLVDKLDDEVIDKIDDEFLEKMEDSITDKLEDAIDERLENIDTSFKWVEVS